MFTATLYLKFKKFEKKLILLFFSRFDLPQSFVVDWNGLACGSTIINPYQFSHSFVAGQLLYPNTDDANSWNFLRWRVQQAGQWNSRRRTRARASARAGKRNRTRTRTRTVAAREMKKILQVRRLQVMKTTPVQAVPSPLWSPVDRTGSSVLLVPSGSVASVTAEALIPFTSVPSVNKLILQHLHLIWIVSVQFEIQNLLVSELPHFFFF